MRTSPLYERVRRMERQGGRMDAMKYEAGREAGSEGEIKCEVVREGG